jgi:hypothetical protein
VLTLSSDEGVKINKVKSSSILLYERRTNYLFKDIVSLCKRESEKDFFLDIIYQL